MPSNAGQKQQAHLAPGEVFGSKQIGFQTSYSNCIICSFHGERQTEVTRNPSFPPTAAV